MSLYHILTIAHVVGAAIGVGAATASDTTFMRSIHNRIISRDQLVIIRFVSRVVMAGLAIVTLTGVGLLLHNPSILQHEFFRVIDLETLRHVRDVEVGEQPIWPRAAPDGRHVFVPNTGSGDVSVIALETLEVVATLPAGNGVHGITFCPNAEGGYYGHVSNKYAATLTVINLGEMRTVGNVRLGDSALGGQGVHCFPDNSYDQQVADRWGR